MKLRPTAMALTVSALLMSAGALASSRVLVPSDSNAPNLGLVPSIPSAPPAAPTSQASTPIATSLPPAASAVPSSTSAPAATTYTPTKPEYVVAINVAPTSWLQADIDNISSQMGLSKDAVASSCRLYISGVITTDRGAFPVKGSGTQTSVAYNGALTHAMVSLSAACDKAPKLAPNAFVLHVGNAYELALGNAFCSPAKAFSDTSHQIILTHVAGGNDSCTYP